MVILKISSPQFKQLNLKMFDVGLKTKTNQHTSPSTTPLVLRGAAEKIL